MNEQTSPISLAISLAAILKKMKWSQEVSAVGVGVVELELPVGVLVVDLVDVDTAGAQGVGQPLQVGARAREALVVVAGLGQRVAGVAGGNGAFGLAHQQREFRLESGIHHQPPGAQACHLFLQRDAAVELPGLVVDVALADDARQPRLPRHHRERGEIAPGHEVGPVRLDAYATDREAGKAGAIAHHRAEMIDRHGLGLGHAMDVDELRQHVLHALRLQVALGLVDRVEARRGQQLGAWRVWLLRSRQDTPSGCGVDSGSRGRAPVLGVGRLRIAGLMFLCRATFVPDSEMATTVRGLARLQGTAGEIPESPA
jgi:hypothetical protein